MLRHDRILPDQKRCGTKLGTVQFADPRARDRPFNWSAAMKHLHGPKPRPEHRTEPSGDIGGLVGFLANAQPGERNNSLFWARTGQPRKVCRPTSY
jgi:hypothetical protein